MIKGILKLIILSFISVVLGGFLAGLSDVFLLTITAGTVFGPGHPATGFAWTAIGFVLTIVIWKLVFN